MNFLGLRSQSTAAHVPQALPPQGSPLAEPDHRKPTATLDDLVAEDPFPLASLVETFDRTSEGIVSENGAFGGLSTKNVVDKHIDVCEEEGWITIPYKELPDTWNEEPDMLSFSSFDRPFLFPGEQVHILACLSAHKQETEIMTPFKVAELMRNKNGRNAKKPHVPDDDNAANGPKKDGESLVRMEDYRRQTEILLQRFRNSHFFARIAEADEPLWSKRKTQETFRESTEMIAYNDDADDANTSSGGVARNGFKCRALANGDIVVLLQVNIGVECLKNSVLEIIQFEKHEEINQQQQLQGAVGGDLLKWLLPIENSLTSSLSPLPHQLSSTTSSSIRTSSTKMKSSSSGGSPMFSFGHFRSYSMSSVPPPTTTIQQPSSAISRSSTTPLLEEDDQNEKDGEGVSMMSFRGVALEPERFSVRCGLQGMYIPGRRWRRKVEIIQPVEITSFTADSNTQDLLCVQIKNVCPAHMPPDIVIYVDTITIIHEEEASTPLSSLPIACIEAGSDHSLPDLALRRGEEHSFILKPAASLSRNNTQPSSSSISIHGPPCTNGVIGVGDKYAVLVSCRCNYTESRLFFKQSTSWRPRMPRDLLISVASPQLSRPTDDARIPPQLLPVQVLTLEASNLTCEDLTLTVLAPASFSCPPSVVSLNTTPVGSPNHGDSRRHGGMGMGMGPFSDDNGPQIGSFNVSFTDVLPAGCTHLWLQSRVPLGCVPCRSTATIKLELLPLTDGIITLDSLQISVKEKGLIYVAEKSLKINATSSISSGIM